MAVHYENIGNAAVITMARPERRNAIDRATADALLEAWRRFDDDNEARVGLLTGAGGNFCSGADLKSFDLVDRPEGFLGFSRMTVSKPTIAAVAGYCVAGGLELALWCDVRVAGEDAVFGCFERRFGVPLVDGGTQRLPRIVGVGRALDMILTGRPVSGSEALRIGLVDRLVPPDQELAAALDLAETVASHPQATMRSDRIALYEGLGKPLDEGLQIERRHGLGAMDSAEEGARLFAKGEGRG